MPPKCCGIEIDTTIAKNLLPHPTFKKFERTLLEITATDPAYCPNRSCSVFLFLDTIKAIGENRFSCPSCGTVVCTACTRRHEGSRHRCRLSSDAQVAKEIKDLHGYQQCYRCRSVVELDFGCNHISCRCGAEFCYVCGTKWKECKCSLWDESKLYREGRERVEAMLRNQDRNQHLLNPLAPLADSREEGKAVALRSNSNVAPLFPNSQNDHFESLLKSLNDRLRHTDHMECRHVWCQEDVKQFGGGGTLCQHCRKFWMYTYRYHCHKCEVSACATCRFHRISRR